jgi:uncharacterized RDD family membrane protein YckC
VLPAAVSSADFPFHYRLTLDPWKDLDDVPRSRRSDRAAPPTPEEVVMTVCARCGHEIVGRPTTCPRCGAPVAVVPPQGAFDDIGDRTVMRAGMQLGADVPSNPAPIPWTDLVGPGAPAPASPSAPPPTPPAEWLSYAQGALVADNLPRVHDPVPAAPLPPVSLPARPGLPPASLGTRFGAHLLDGLIVTGGLLVVYLLMLVLATGAAWLLGNVSYTAANAVAGVLTFVGAIAYIAVPVGYVIWGWANGQTLGKRALKIAVVDVQTGQPIGASRAIIRYLMMAVMGLPCYLGYLSILAADGRGWHDKAANSRVVVCLDWPAPVLFRKR